jgi:small subunit ribosomal protein S5
MLRSLSAARACRCTFRRSIQEQPARLFSILDGPGPIDYNIDGDREILLENLEALLKHQNEMRDEDGGEEDAGKRVRGITSSVLSVGRVQKPTKGGKVMSYKALVVAGNMDGAAGYGTSKGKTVQTAVQKALLDARRNMIYVERHADKTLFHDVTGVRGSTKVTLRAAPPGKGIKASHIVRSICAAFGIEDCVSKCIGQRNPYSVVHVSLASTTSCFPY